MEMVKISPEKLSSKIDKREIAPNTNQKLSSKRVQISISIPLKKVFKVKILYNIILLYYAAIYNYLIVKQSDLKLMIK